MLTWIASPSWVAGVDFFFSFDVCLEGTGTFTFNVPYSFLGVGVGMQDGPTIDVFPWLLWDSSFLTWSPKSCAMQCPKQNARTVDRLKPSEHHGSSHRLSLGTGSGEVLLFLWKWLVTSNHNCMLASCRALRHPGTQTLPDPLNQRLCGEIVLCHSFPKLSRWLYCLDSEKSSQADWLWIRSNSLGFFKSTPLRPQTLHLCPS